MKWSLLVDVIRNGGFRPDDEISGGRSRGGIHRKHVIQNLAPVVLIPFDFLSDVRLEHSDFFVRERLSGRTEPTHRVVQTDHSENCDERGPIFAHTRAVPTRRDQFEQKSVDQNQPERDSKDSNDIGELKQKRKAGERAAQIAPREGQVAISAQTLTSHPGKRSRRPEWQSEIML